MASPRTAGPGEADRGLRGLPDLLRGRGLRRLLVVRLLSQGGDGAFQVGLASLLLFSPERAATVQAAAGLFALTLLPYTLVGPFVGTLLDRWRRRQVLVVASLVRGVLVLCVAALVGLGGLGDGAGGAVGVVAVLVCLSVNRFFLAGLGAGLPHVVRGDALVLANAVTPTVGTIALGVGGALAAVVRAGAGGGDRTDALVLTLAGAAVLGSAAAALRLAPDALGRGSDHTEDPSHPDRHDRSAARGTRSPDAAGSGRRTGAHVPLARRLLPDTAEGVRHLRERPVVARAIAAVGVHRFAYGVLLVATILLTRNRFADHADPDAGFALLGLVLGATTAGITVSVLVTPSAAARWGPQRWVVVCLAVAAAATAVLAAALTLPVLVGCALVVGTAGQSLKICADAVVQAGVGPGHRGRVLSVHDAVFNGAFVLAAVVCALVVPADGASPPVLAALAVLYGLTALVLGRHLRAGRPRQSPRRPSGP